jgi:N-methylhydantoinase B
MVLSALADVASERVIAGAGSPLWCVNMAGTRADGRSFANLFFLNGGYGASASADGTNVLSWPSNISSTPVEIIEQLAPLKVHFRRLRPLAGANGAFRGGTGQETLLESVNPSPLMMSFMAERTRPEAAAPGIRGGLPGAPGEILIDGSPVDPKSRHVIETGAKVLLRTPGGGGCGQVNARPQDLIEKDLIGGYVDGCM